MVKNSIFGLKIHLTQWIPTYMMFKHFFWLIYMGYELFWGFFTDLDPFFIQFLSIFMKFGRLKPFIEGPIWVQNLEQISKIEVFSKSIHHTSQA